MQNTQTDTLETVGIPSHGKRIDEMDFLKAVFIILMITFHLTFIGNTYPYAKQLVYTFHVPAFLVISGYFVSIGKPWGKFLKSMWWIFLPYAVMECGYTAMASVLPIRDHIDGLSVWVVVRNVFATPLGPYWYLHTLVLCSLVYYFIFHYLRGRARALNLFIGRNTLVLLVFSPVFTVLTKLFQPYLLRVDGSGILFMVVAVIFTVAGCFGTVYVMDWLHLSRYFFGQEKELK